MRPLSFNPWKVARSERGGGHVEGDDESFVRGVYGRLRLVISCLPLSIRLFYFKYFTLLYFCYLTLL